MPNRKAAKTKKTKTKPAAQMKAIKAAAAKLFTSDIEELQRRCEQTGIPWGTQLRALVHEAIVGPRLRAFKFIIGDAPRDIPVPLGTLQYSKMGAVQTAHSREEAVPLLKTYGAMNGLDGRWIEVADVVEIPLDRPSTLIWAQG
jgi:hypothetical protein